MPNPFDALTSHKPRNRGAFSYLEFIMHMNPIIIIITILIALGAVIEAIGIGGLHG